MFGQKLFGSKKTTKGKATRRQDPIAEIMEQETVKARSSTVEAAGSTEPARTFEGY